MNCVSLRELLKPWSRGTWSASVERQHHSRKRSQTGCVVSERSLRGNNQETRLEPSQEIPDSFMDIGADFSVVETADQLSAGEFPTSRNVKSQFGVLLERKTRSRERIVPCVCVLRIQNRQSVGNPIRIIVNGINLVEKPIICDNGEGEGSAGRPTGTRREKSRYRARSEEKTSERPDDPPTDGPERFISASSAASSFNHATSRTDLFGRTELFCI